MSTPHIHSFVVTSVDVKDTPHVTLSLNGYGEDAKWVGFSGNIKSAKGGDKDFVYLMDVRRGGELDDNGWFQDHTWYAGVEVTEETFVKAIAKTGKKVLACVHGFNVEPTSWLKTCWSIGSRQVVDSTKELFWDNHIVLPVIWPGNGEKNVLYKTEQNIAAQAGVAFKNISNAGKNKVSLMCHSMGNRVLMAWAQSFDAVTYEKVFDNVFMVAADVWEECFNDRVHSGEEKYDFENAGWKLCQMVTRKIYVAHYEKDRALGRLSEVMNLNRRLGVFGTQTQIAWNRMNGVHNLKHKLEDYDMNTPDRIEAMKAEKLDASQISGYHSYQALPCVVKELYYAKMKD